MSSPYATCVSVSWKPRTETDGGWWAQLHWACGALSAPETIEGVISNRHPTGLRLAIDRVLHMGEQLGLRVPDHAEVGLWAEGDGEDPGVQLPAGWKLKLQLEAARRGWVTYSSEEPAEGPWTDEH